MKIDLYTKFVLTVIAISLSALTIKFTVTDAHAQPRFNTSPPFQFTDSGALVVTICDSNRKGNGLFYCAEVHKLEK